MPVDTYGIRHVHLLVRDHERSISFYASVFGMEERFRDGDIVFVSSPSGHDSLALHAVASEDDLAKVGHQGGYEHFGITVKDRAQLDEAIALVIDAGGALVDKGEHAPGIPYAYVSDPDGYVIEI